MTTRDERRRDPRAEICASAIVLARHNDGVAFTIESISVSGARLAGPLALDVGERVHLLFEMDGHPVEVTGEVVRVDRQDLASDHIAVRFIEVAEDTRALIRDLVVRTLDLQAEGASDDDE